MAVRKVERLLNLIALLLETPKPLTAQEIRDTIPGYGQEKWQSFLRMFERDKDELRDMGIPLERAHTDVWETEEGYRIPKERYYLPELELAPDEVAALFAAAGLLRLQDPGTVRTALLKLAGDVPQETERSSLSWLAADLRLSGKELARAFQAVAEKRRVHFPYRSRSEEKILVEKTRKVEPYGLVHRRGVWYLVGNDSEAKDLRSFRLDRLTGEIRFDDPTGAGEEFEPPKGFRPLSALEAPPFTQGDPVAIARVRFRPSIAWRVERESPWLSLEWAVDGSAEARIEVTDTDGFISWLLWLGEEAEVLDPPGLRKFILDRLEEICA